MASVEAKPKKPEASILVTSYNQRPTLELLLASLERQTRKDFEVVIADDGSSDGTDELCRAPRPFPVIFVTQEDLGYRKSKILNKALHRANADYLIFMDGDVVVEKHFVEDHLTLRRPDRFICGRRVDLGPEFTKGVTLAGVQRGQFDRIQPKLFWSVLKKDSLHFNRGLRITNSWLRRVLGYDRPMDLLGSNFSAWKADVIAVNGFNEALESYWGEDGDLYIRLRNSGKKAIGAKAICVQHHLFHKRREPTPENVAQYERLLKTSDYIRAPKGYAEAG